MTDTNTLAPTDVEILALLPTVKAHDPNSPTRCIACDWNGERYQLAYTDEDQNND